MDLGGEEVNLEEDKENHNTENLRNGQKSALQVKGLEFGANADKPRGGPRDGKKERRVGSTRPMENSNKWPKPVRQNQPGRGLVFGPPNNEAELSSSGKRLRVEKANLGRPGGPFSNGGEGSDTSGSSEQRNGSRNEISKDGEVDTSMAVVDVQQVNPAGSLAMEGQA